MNPVRCLIGGCWFLLAMVVHAQGNEMLLEMIPLKHRFSEDVEPVIRPLVVPGGTVTGLNNQIIVKTTRENLEEIRRIISSIDRVPRKLMVTVKQDVNENLRREDRSISGHYESDHVAAVAIIPSARRGSERVTIRDDNGNILSYRASSTRSTSEDNNTYSVRATEGYPAFIRVGHFTPVASKQIFVTFGSGVTVRDRVEYRDVTSGFYLLPKLNGDTVTLFVTPQLSRGNSTQGGMFDIQNVKATVSGRLGKWIRIGEVSQQFADGEHDSFEAMHEDGWEFRDIAVKVTEIE